MELLELIMLQHSRSDATQQRQRGGLQFGRGSSGVQPSVCGKRLGKLEDDEKKTLSPPGIICPRANMTANLQISNLTT